jgi:hypothetical protein
MSWAFNARGAITATYRQARTIRPHGEEVPVPAKLSARFIKQAEGLEREAEYARTEGRMLKARECMAHAAKLRIEAQSAVACHASRVESIAPHSISPNQ